MAQLCKNGVGECSGCGFCFGASVRCTVCGKEIDVSREKYYTFCGEAVCARCVYAGTEYVTRRAQMKELRLPPT